MKARVLLLCGGQSGEHEVSLASARSVVGAAGAGLHVTPLVIDKAGALLSPEASQRALGAGRVEADAVGSALQSLQPGRYDVVFPLLHGPRGEDGSVQGLLKLMGLPFVGSDVLGSAVGMDKLMMKAVFGAHGLPQVPFQGVKRTDWQTRPEQVLSTLQTLNYPLFVKPANLGSSVGIGKAVDEESLRDALDEAIRHDRRIIVEQGLVGARELEVGVLGNDAPATSPVGEIRFIIDFYDYEAKYTEGRADLVIPADIPTEIAEHCRALALRAFEAIDAAGLARVDFFYQELSGELYLNEINTMPGFTTTSMYPKLWAAAGVPYGDLVERLVALALERSGE
ncbi:D-alanine--D-alanine ligase family protein [soil metagenome]